MPLYEYKCEACDEEFEEIRMASDTSLVLCPKCEEPVEKKPAFFSYGIGTRYNFNRYGGGGG